LIITTCTDHRFYLTTYWTNGTSWFFYAGYIHILL